MNVVYKINNESFFDLEPILSNLREKFSDKEVVLDYKSKVIYIKESSVISEKKRY